MEQIPREIIKANKRLGDALGMNPHGEPLYKWIWANTWMHWMRDITGYEPTATESGLIVMLPIYKHRRMIVGLDNPDSPHRDRWHVGHWHDCGPEYIWRCNYGSDALWSAKGSYAQTDIWSQQGQLPTAQTTDDLIVRVKQYRQMSLADARKKFEDDDANTERSASSERQACIGDALTAFLNVPGTRSGNTQFPSTSAQLLRGE